MVDLGVMTTDGKIVRTRYDKFRQINRFLEFIEDILPRLIRIRNRLLLTLDVESLILHLQCTTILRSLRATI